MKTIMRIVIYLALVTIMCITMVACSKKGDDGSRTLKPTYDKVFANYEKINDKRADMEAKATVKLYGNTDKTTGAINFFEAGGKLSATRIRNKEQFYMNGKLTGFSSDNVLGLINLVDKESSGAMAPYLNGTNYLQFVLGYNGADYNLKVNSYEANRTKKKKDENGNLITVLEEKRNWWFGANEKLAEELIKDMLKYDVDIEKFFNIENFDAAKILSQYLMFSSFINFNELSKWIKEDKASPYFVTKGNIYDYDMTINGDKIKEFIFSQIENLLKMYDTTVFKDFLAKANKALAFVKEWITIGTESCIDAQANINGMPVAMKTVISVKINIDLVQLNEIMLMFFGDSQEQINNIDQIMGMLNFLNLTMLKGINNETGKIGVEIVGEISERYSYDAESINLSNKDIDGDVFIPVSEEVAGRKVFPLASEVPPVNPETPVEKAFNEPQLFIMPKRGITTYYTEAMTA